MKSALKSWVAAAAVLGMAGCSMDMMYHPEPPAGAREGFTFDDIPSPQNFSLDRFNTYGYSYTNFAVHTTVFHGNDRLDSLARFYQSQMPIFGWEFKGGSQEPHPALTFENRHEKCVVHLIPESRDSVVVRIERDLR